AKVGYSVAEAAKTEAKTPGVISNATADDGLPGVCSCLSHQRSVCVCV
uniref:Uncharacterized protein n=1 Tax=Anopheles quadriannulatus TaxID=34691 RepID=A0A182XRP1_ANOQN